MIGMKSFETDKKKKPAVMKKSDAKVDKKMIKKQESKKGNK